MNVECIFSFKFKVQGKYVLLLFTSRRPPPSSPGGGLGGRGTVHSSFRSTLDSYILLLLSGKVCDLGISFHSSAFGLRAFMPQSAAH